MRGVRSHLGILLDTPGVVFGVDPAEIPKLGVPEGGRGWWDVTQGAQTARIPRGGAWAEAEHPAHSHGPKMGSAAGWIWKGEGGIAAPAP